MDIEFLFWDGCPSHPEAKRLLDDVIAEQDLDVEVKVLEVRTQVRPTSSGSGLAGEEPPVGDSAPVGCTVKRRSD